MPILIESKTKESPLWRQALICFGLFVVFSILFFNAAQDMEQEFQLYRHGIFTEGTALKGEPVRGGYSLFYEFNYNGSTYQGVSDVKESWLNSAKFPMTIRVHFLADDPNISRVPEARDDFLLWFNAFFCCFAFLAVVLLGVVFVIMIRAG